MARRHFYVIVFTSVTGGNVIALVCLSQVGVCHLAQQDLKIAQIVYTVQFLFPSWEMV
jgi:hypothetical protein